MRTNVAAALAVLASTSLVAGLPPAREAAREAALGSLVDLGGIDFGALASRFLASHPVAGKAESEVTLEELIASHYLLAEVGALDVRIPREFLADEAALADFRAALAAVLGVHRAWLDWTGAPAEAAARAKADVAEIEKLLKTARLAPGGAQGGDFFEALEKGSTLRPALERLRDGFRTGTALGFTPRATDAQVFVLAPTRRNFVELAGVLGHFEESSRGVYWNDGLTSWTELLWNRTQVVALQYPKPAAADFGEGVDMDEREPTGLAQHVAQRAAVALCWQGFGDTLDPAFEMAIAQALVIDLHGQNNTRSGGTGRANSIDGVTAFVPGGNPNGGMLPPTNAESEWRKSLGSDYFLKALREAQKGGAKAASKAAKGKPAGDPATKQRDEKLAKQVWFELHADDPSRRMPVAAPFLGSGTRGKALPPAEFLTDYLEFFRAYKTAFAHWLREESRPKAQESRAKLAELLAKSAEAGGAATFEELVVEVYGVPYSDADLTKESLEASFLRWLAGS